jgi:hypothetical protein
MATQAEYNAATAAAQAAALGLIRKTVPFMFESTAEHYLTQYPNLVRDIAIACVDAAENARRA